MSASQDDCGRTTQIPEPDHWGDTEPADPELINHETRRETPLGTNSTSIKDLPTPFADQMDGNRLPTVLEARDVYMRNQRVTWNADDKISTYERHLNETYPRLCVADRQLRERYNDVTTVMITRRLSPMKDRRWMPPLEIDHQLHNSKVWRSVRRQWRRVLDAHEFEYVAVSAPTSSAGTPHQHIYLWIEDIENGIQPVDFEPVIEKQLKHCPNAYKEDHRYDEDGQGGTVTVRHDPSVTDQGPRKAITKGAQYLASQLAHLPLGDFYNSEEEKPAEALLEGAAVAWASSHKWFRSSQGLPDLEDGNQDS